MLRAVESYRDMAFRNADAWNREDLDAWLEFYDAAGQYHTSGRFPGLQPVYRGHEELALFWRTMHEPWETLHVDVDRFEEGADWTVVGFRFRARGAESGAAVDMRFCNASVIRNGRAIHVFARENFEDAIAALEEAGVDVGR